VRGDNGTRHDARKIAFIEAKQPCAGQIGMLLASETVVSVKAGHDTRVKVGVLRIIADNSTTYRVLDQTQQRELAKGYGKSVFGFPVGRYMMHLRQRNEPVTIEVGPITEY
jgi:hypothetical protein